MGDDVVSGTQRVLTYDRWRFRAGEGEEWDWDVGDRVSHLSVLLYLSTHQGNEEATGKESSADTTTQSKASGVVSQGETVLLPDSGRALRVRPVVGDALVFPQSFKLGRPEVLDSEYSLLHAGSRLGRAGETKYVLRSDILYTLPDRPSESKVKGP
jgi:hypothetical protein